MHMNISRLIDQETILDIKILGDDQLIVIYTNIQIITIEGWDSNLESGSIKCDQDYKSFIGSNLIGVTTVTKAPQMVVRIQKNLSGHYILNLEGVYAFPKSRVLLSVTLETPEGELRFLAFNKIKKQKNYLIVAKAVPAL